MKVVQINATCGVGSTGKIVLSVSKLLCDNNITNFILYSSKKSSYIYSYKFSNVFEQKISALFGRIFGNNGFNAFISTKRLIRKLDSINPDIIHLHNLHANDVNLNILLNYLIKKKIKVFYTFHDCWAFTGYCVFFTAKNCSKYQTICNNCPVYKQYSWFFDKSNVLFERKKALFNDLDFTIVVPSVWLMKSLEKSFLSTKKVVVINNGINLNVFKPVILNEFRKKYHCLDKKIILGVAYGWGYRKGLDVFVELSKMLPDDFQIVLVGTNNKVDKSLPENIISIHRTNDQKELASIYSDADVFFNPTREDNFPTTNIESLACGTPVVTFNTGGSPEVIDDDCGVVLKTMDLNEAYAVLVDICTNHPFSRQNCISRASSFNEKDRFLDYLHLYTELKETN